MKMNSNFNKSLKGFSLIELLVVMTIMIGLVSVVLVSVNKSLSSGRDGQIRADVQTLKLALARTAQFGVGGKYPGNASTWYCLKVSGTCNLIGQVTGTVSIVTSNASAANSILANVPGKTTFPLPPGIVPASSYIYNASDTTNKIAGYVGPILLWWQEKTIPQSDCNGTVVVFSATHNLCYERLQ